jgi:hypothetical protein
MSETRKLAAILAADVVGFSKLAGSCEIVPELRRLKANQVCRESARGTGSACIATVGYPPCAETCRIRFSAHACRLYARFHRRRPPDF